MLPEVGIVFDSNDVVCVVRVIFFQMQQDLQLHSCLVLKLLLVPNDLDCYNLMSFVIVALDCLTETSFAQKINDLKSECKVILQNDVVISSVIVISKVEILEFSAFMLFCSKAKVIYLFVVKNFALFILGDTWSLQIVL